MQKDAQKKQQLFAVRFFKQNNLNDSTIEKHQFEIWTTKGSLKIVLQIQNEKTKSILFTLFR